MSAPQLSFTEDFAIGYEGKPVAQVSSTLALSPQPGSAAITILTGSNGSGKTTLLRTLSGILPPLSGLALWGKLKLPHLQRRGGVVYLPETLDFLPDLTAMQIIASITGRPKNEIRASAAQIELSSLSLPFWKLSKGNRQKVRFLVAYFQSKTADLVLLDEPFTGFDIESRAIAMKLLSDIFQDSKRLLISLHTEKIPLGWSDSSLSIVKGKIVAGPPFSSVYDAKEYFNSAEVKV